MYPICYQWVSGGYLQPEPTMYSRCFHWFPGPLTPSVTRKEGVLGMVNTASELVDVAFEGVVALLDKWGQNPRRKAGGRDGLCTC